MQLWVAKRRESVTLLSCGIRVGRAPDDDDEGGRKGGAGAAARLSGACAPDRSRRCAGGHGPCLLPFFLAQMPHRALRRGDAGGHGRFSCAAISISTVT